jgi:hypothetical protein
MRSAMVDRSSSAKLASSWKRNLPIEVDVSNGSVALRIVTPAPSSAAWASSRTRSDRPSRSRR